jgi:hypothetical protein
MGCVAPLVAHVAALVSHGATLSDRSRSHSQATIQGPNDIAERPFLDVGN